MALLPETFNATDHAGSDFEVLPPGTYALHVTSSEMKPTKRGDGQYLALTFEVLDGPHKGRLVFENLNLVNPNEKAVRIAKRRLSELCLAVGKPNIADSSELHHVPVFAELGVEPGQGEYGPRNRIEKFLVEKSTPAAAPVAAATSGSEPAPWS